MIAILTQNALEYTERCLASIARKTPVPHRVFVLDNASTDGTVDWLRAQANSDWRLELSQINLGVPGGRNRLLQQILPELADDDFIVFLDNDVEVHERWYEPYVELFAARKCAGVARAMGHAIIVHSDHRELLPSPSIGPAPVEVVAVSVSGCAPKPRGR